MTNEKARAILSLSAYVMSGTDGYKEAVARANNALRKQEPEEPVKPYAFKKILDENGNGFETYALGKCVCGFTLVQDVKQRYCPNCGQKLDFSKARSGK